MTNERLQKHCAELREKLSKHPEQGFNSMLIMDEDLILMLDALAPETIQQLHAAVKTAQELAARRLMEINRLQTYNVAQGTLLLTVQQENERLKGEAEVADEQLAQLRGFAEAHKTCRGSDEPCEQPQYRKWPGEPPHCMSCDCGMTDEQKRTVPEADYLRVHKELMDLKYPQQAASRDTSSDLCPKCGESTDMPIGAYHRCAPRNASPADLVGALQDVVHTDPGPVRAAAAVKSIECPQCFGDKRISMSDGSSRRCEYCDGTGRAILKSK